jgi:hypothetical protein
LRKEEHALDQKPRLDEISAIKDPRVRSARHQQLLAEFDKQQHAPFGLPMPVFQVFRAGADVSVASQMTRPHMPQNKLGWRAIRD